MKYPPPATEGSQIEISKMLTHYPTNSLYWLVVATYARHSAVNWLEIVTDPPPALVEISVLFINSHYKIGTYYAKH